MRVNLQWAVLATLVGATAAFGHASGDGHLTVSPDGDRLDLRWDLALRDLDRAVVLDTDGDGQLTGRELKAGEARLNAYAISRLKVESDGRLCEAGPVGQGLTQHSDGAHLVFTFALHCPARSAQVVLTYTALFDVDPLHRGLVRLTSQPNAPPRVVGPDTSRIALDLSGGASATATAFLGMVREGVWHIWIGIDHLLFLIALLLPAVLRREEGRWIPAARFWPVAREVLKVVTAFTVAHSLTLAVAQRGWMVLDMRWVETAIAVSVLVAAANNLHPLIPARWMLALPLGLLHGFGFASVLGDLGASASQSLSALLAFNLGVELGQLAVVVAFLPVAYLGRATRLYRYGAFAAGSLAIVAVASVWSWERAFGG